MKKILASEMSFSEFGEYVKENDTIIIPVGVSETHGHHNPLGVDNFIAEYTAKLIGEKSGVAVAPLMPYGVTQNLQNYAGTISLDPMIYNRLLTAYAESYVKHGIKRVLFVNGHGGNNDVLTLVCRHLTIDLKVVAAHTEWWEDVPKIDASLSCEDHGGQYETSVMMVVKPELLSMEKMKEPPEVLNLTDKIYYKKGWVFDNYKLSICLDMKEFNAPGNVGLSPRLADKETGKKVVDIYVDFNVDLIKELKKITL